MNRLVRHLAFALAALGLVSSPALAADFHEIKAAASPAGGAWYVGMGAIGKAISSKHPEIDVAIFPGGGLANPLHVDMGRSDFGIAAMPSSWRRARASSRSRNPLKICRACSICTTPR